VTIAMDETGSREPGALASGATPVVVLKVGRSGGISALLAAASLVRATGCEPLIASNLDGPVATAAAVHAAAALRITRPCGLATLDSLDFDDTPDLARLAAQLAVRSGAIRVPVGPGLFAPATPPVAVAP